MNRSLKDQLRALAERSVGESSTPAEGHEPWGVDDLDVYTRPESRPSRERRVLVASAALLLAVISLVAVLAVRRSDDTQQVATPPTTEVDSQLVSSARVLAETSATQSTGRAPDRAEAVVTTVGSAMELAAFLDGSCDPSESFVVYQFTWNEPVTYLFARGQQSAAAPTGTALQLGRSGMTAIGAEPGCGDYLGFTPEPIDLSTLGEPVSVDLGTRPATGGPPAGWQLRTDDITAESTRFDAAVTRSECAGGQSGDVGGPVVDLTATEVVVTFRPPALPSGLQTCPSNAPTLVEVDLGQPLGDRVLVDGGCLEGGLLPTSGCERWRP